MAVLYEISVHFWLVILRS